MQAVVQVMPGPDGAEHATFPAHRDAEVPGGWVAEFEAADGDRYGIRLDGGPLLFDPHTHDLLVGDDGAMSVVRDPWPRRPQGAPLTESPVVYELHVKGFGGSYLGCIDHLAHVRAVGANVIELMPVHPFNPGTNYWGYMPVVWGAVHRGYAQQPDRADRKSVV